MVTLKVLQVTSEVSATCTLNEKVGFSFCHRGLDLQLSMQSVLIPIEVCYFERTYSIQLS